MHCRISFPYIGCLVKTVTIRTANAEPMATGSLHGHPLVFTGNDKWSQPLQARDFQVYRICLDIKMCSRIMAYSLNDDLYTTRWGNELNERRGRIRLIGHGITQRCTPEAGFREQIIRLIIYDNIPKPCFCAWVPPDVWASFTPRCNTIRASISCHAALPGSMPIGLTDQDRDPAAHLDSGRPPGSVVCCARARL
jgi:hypothetical protein